VDGSGLNPQALTDPLEGVDGGAGSPSGSDDEGNLSGVDGGAKTYEGIVDPDGNVVH
jgi:hypothetical protein